MAIRRQASPLSDLDYEVYNEDLAQFDVADVEAVCLAVGRAEREDGETAMPSIGRLIRMCKALRRERRETQEEARRAEEIRYMKAHPELYAPFDLSEFVAEWSARRSLPAPSVESSAEPNEEPSGQVM